MKRRYKQGDWLRVPLGGEHDALALIARACRSRLFGYFFAIPAAHTPTHDELRALNAGEALCALLFGGGPIEHARWPCIATSLAYDPRTWPFPDFASRGAFGESWTRVRYDPATLQIAERRSIDAGAAAELPDARFSDATEVETILRRRIAGVDAPRAQRVVEVRSPLDLARLRSLEHGGRLQFSTALSARDLDAVAAFAQAHPHVEVRVHGFRHGFDAAALSRMRALRNLTLDVHRLQHPHALRELRDLCCLRIGGAALDLGFLESLKQLQTLELRGTRATFEPVRRVSSLRSLVLENTAPFDFESFESARILETLVLAHGEYDLAQLGRLTNLRRLDLRALDVSALPPVHALARLEHLQLDGLVHVTDLRAIAKAPALRDLRVAAMPQLNVPDFEPLQACAGLCTFEVDLGSRRKEREIYRLMQRGNRCEL